MNLSEAKAELARPLQFGHQRQIESLEYLRLLVSLRARMDACHYCKGEGFVFMRSGKSPRLCRCIRHEPRHVIDDLRIYRAMVDAELRQKGYSSGGA